MCADEAVVFDFDLTLVESTEAVVDCANHALQALGFPPVGTDRIRQTIGLPLAGTFHALAGTDDPDLTRAYLDHYRARADLVMVDMVRFLPGAASALRAIRHHGLRTAIVSSRFRYRIAAMLERAALHDTIDVIVGAEDVAHPKPDPEGIHRALTALALASDSVVYVGDHQVDAEAAAAAGVRFVAVLSGMTGRDAWACYTPLAIIDSVADLPRVLVR